MKQSAELNLLIKAMTEANSKITNPKNTAANSFFKSKYAPLDSILTQIRPILNSCGLVIIQNVSTDERFVSIETGIYHTSGQYIISDKLQMSAEKATAQGQGSAITYGRRYQISAFLNIASEDDDDEKHVSHDAKPEEKQKGVIDSALKAIESCADKDSLIKIKNLMNQRAWTKEEQEQLEKAIEQKEGIL